MHEVIAGALDFLRSLYNADRLLEMVRGLLANPVGMAGLIGIVFAETGLLVGFFLPGDSLLFTIGVASGAAGVNVYVLAGLLMCAAIAGDNVGYFLGRKAGPRIFSRPKSRFFHPDHLRRTREFYGKYGPRAVVYARFVPIVRTCTPFISGVAAMPYAKFLTFSLFGGIMWIALMTTLGYQMGQVAIVRQNFEKVVLGVIFISLLPILFELLKTRGARPAA
jgi:membrane-associated protein